MGMNYLNTDVDVLADSDKISFLRKTPYPPSPPPLTTTTAYPVAGVVLFSAGFD